MNFGNTTKTLLSGALALVLIFSPVTVGAQSGGGALPFQVRDIRVEGLQRIPVERVYAEEVEPGCTVNGLRARERLKARMVDVGLLVEHDKCG